MISVGQRLAMASAAAVLPEAVGPAKAIGDKCGMPSAKIGNELVRGAVKSVAGKANIALRLPESIEYAGTLIPLLKGTYAMSQTTTSTSSADLTIAMQSITEVIIQALEAPLRAQVEACVQAIVAEATKDIYARVVAAVGQIQPVNIPINLCVQPTLSPIVQPVSQVVPVVLPVIPEPEPEPAPKPEPEPKAPSAPEKEPVLQMASPFLMPVPVPAPRVTPKSMLASVSKPMPEFKPLPTVVKHTKKSLSITVVGLKPGQAHMIKNEFKFINLHFISSDAGAGKQLKSLAKTNDYVVQMVDFIRHTVGNSIKSVSGNWICISGGMTKLREKLEELNHANTNTNNINPNALPQFGTP